MKKRFQALKRALAKGNPFLKDPLFFVHMQKMKQKHCADNTQAFNEFLILFDTTQEDFNDAEEILPKIN
jgi:hypothetical protein